MGTGHATDQLLRKIGFGLMYPSLEQGYQYRIVVSILPTIIFHSLHLFLVEDAESGCR